MLDKAQRRMTREEFYAWQEGNRNLEISLALADIYDEIEFRPVPKLVDGSGG